MSGHNAERTLPPGDRDDAPAIPPNASLADPLAGREVAPAVGGGGLLPGLTLELDRIGQLLDEQQMVLADVKLGRSQASWPILQSSARRLSVLAHHTELTINAARSQCAPAQQAAE